MAHIQQIEFVDIHPESMTPKYYRYSVPIQVTKVFSWLWAGLCLVILILTWTVLPARLILHPELVTYDVTQIFMVVLAPPLGIVAFVAFNGVYSDIGVDDDGLSVQFLWREIHVPWKAIQSIHKVPRLIKLIPRHEEWLIVVKGLTPFHRLYSLWYGVSKEPGFIVSHLMANHLELLAVIKQHAHH